MKEVATALLFDKDNRLLIYLRDNKPEIAYPNYWDLFGGLVEPGESPQQALLREINEELNVDVSHYQLLFTVDTDDLIGNPNRKYVFLVPTHYAYESFQLQEGQCLKAIRLKEYTQYEFANVLSSILASFIAHEAAIPYL